MPRRPTRCLPLLVLLACGNSGDAPEASSFAIDTIAGVEHATNLRPAASWRLEPIARLGAGPELPPEQEFGRISAVVLDEAGNLYVGDASAREVRVFDPSGTHVRTFGGSGSGPGEIGALYSLGWLGDTLTVMDPENARLGLFDTAGNWIGQLPFPRLTGDPSTIRFFPTGVGELYLPSLGPDRSVRSWQRLEAGGAASELTVQQPQTGGSSAVLCRGAGMIAAYGNPTAPGWVFSPAPEGRVIGARTSDYRLALLSAAGDTTRVIAHRAAPRPVADTTTERIRTAYESWRNELGDVTCEPNDLGYFDEHPVIRQVVFDDQGRMWVESDTREGVHWDVFDATGRLVGSAPAPDRLKTPVPHLRNGRMALVAEDPSGAHVVHVFAVAEDGG